MKKFIQAILELAASIRELAKSNTAASIKMEAYAYSLKPTKGKAEKPSTKGKPVAKKNGTPRKHNTPWSEKDIEMLKTLVNAGVSYSEIGRILERYPKNCNQYVIDHKELFKN